MHILFQEAHTLCYFELAHNPSQIVGKHGQLVGGGRIFCSLGSLGNNFGDLLHVIAGYFTGRGGLLLRSGGDLVDLHRDSVDLLQDVTQCISRFCGF